MEFAQRCCLRCRSVISIYVSALESVCTYHKQIHVIYTLAHIQKACCIHKVRVCILLGYYYYYYSRICSTHQSASLTATRMRCFETSSMLISMLLYLCIYVYIYILNACTQLLYDAMRRILIGRAIQTHTHTHHHCHPT